MLFKKRRQTYDFYDFACAIAERIDFAYYILHSLYKDKFHPFRIIKSLIKEAPYKSFYRRFNFLSAWNKWSGVK